MSSIINNLNQIYEVKQQIKEILHTDEDVFSYYPGLIEQAISTGGAYGTVTLESNGTHEIGAYAYAYVNVPQEEVPVVPPGYTYTSGGTVITSNGYNIDIASYSYVNVAVPTPEGFIYPSGWAYITTNGDFNIREFESVNVNVPSYATGYTLITENGDYNISSYEYAYVTVNSGITPSGTYSITSNGNGIDIATYAYVDVNVPQEGLDWDDVASYGYIVPVGTINIQSNGTYPVGSYANAYVSVSQSVENSYSYVTGISLDNGSGNVLPFSEVGDNFVLDFVLDGNDYPYLNGYSCHAYTNILQTNGQYTAFDIYFNDYSIISESGTNNTISTFVNNGQSTNINIDARDYYNGGGTYDLNCTLTVPKNFWWSVCNSYISWVPIIPTPSYTSVTWSDLTYIDENHNVQYKGPADGTVVQMTDTVVDGNTVLGYNQVTSEVISQLTNYGATDVATHLNSYIGSYLNFFTENDVNPMGGGLMAIVTPNALTAGSYATVTGPIYDLSPYQEGGGLWMWLEIDEAQNS